MSREQSKGNHDSNESVSAACQTPGAFQSKRYQPNIASPRQSHAEHRHVCDDSRQSQRHQEWNCGVEPAKDEQDGEERHDHQQLFCRGEIVFESAPTGRAEGVESRRSGESEAQGLPGTRADAVEILHAAGIHDLPETRDLLVNANVRRADGRADPALLTVAGELDAPGRDSIHRRKDGTIRAGVQAERARAEEVDDREPADDKGQARDPGIGQVAPEIGGDERGPAGLVGQDAGPWEGSPLVDPQDLRPDEHVEQRSRRNQE